MTVNWDAIGALGEVAGAIGVVATLVYLSVQIRQNTQVTRASTAQQMTNNWVLVNLEMSRNEIVTRNVDFSQPGEELQMVLSFWRAMFHQWSNCHYQFNYGSLDEVLFLPTAEEIGGYARDKAIGPNIRAAWAATQTLYNAEFQSFMRQLLADNPMPAIVLKDQV